MDPPVFLGSAGVILTFLYAGTVHTASTAAFFEYMQQFILGSLGWFYVLTTAVVFGFVLYFGLGRYGGLRLGKDDERPAFSILAWFAMLFSAGMGTGLVFWAVAEPITHFYEPPFAAADTGTLPEARRHVTALRWTFFHWGLQPWAVYVLLGLALAYYHFRCDLPLAPRSLLYPFLGRAGIHGVFGRTTDVVAVTGTLFGVATSLGFGAMQINAGLASIPVLNVSQSAFTQFLIIAVITAAATVSVVLGIQAGIRRLSMLNIALAALLLLFVFVAGPTDYLVRLFFTGAGEYLQQLPAMSLRMELSPDADWQQDWTLFYWGWWISWCPFVGMFVARISKGRTVREFVLGVLMVPTIATLLWLSVFGGTALYFESDGRTELQSVVEQDAALSLHHLLANMPFAEVTTVFATVLVIVFFITSSDSGSLVDDMITSGGHPHPPRAQRVFWAVAEGATAATLLLAGGLQALRTASLTSGLPMALLLLTASFGLLRSLRKRE